MASPIAACARVPLPIGHRASWWLRVTDGAREPPSRQLAALFCGQICSKRHKATQRHRCAEVEALGWASPKTLLLVTRAAIPLKLTGRQEMAKLLVLLLLRRRRRRNGVDTFRAVCVRVTSASLGRTRSASHRGLDNFDFDFHLDSEFDCKLAGLIHSHIQGRKGKHAPRRRPLQGRGGETMQLVGGWKMGRQGPFVLGANYAQARRPRPSTSAVAAIKSHWRKTNDRDWPAGWTYVCSAQALLSGYLGAGVVHCFSRARRHSRRRRQIGARLMLAV